MDLRHIALILDAGKTAAEDIKDAGLSATLSAMTETAVQLALVEDVPTDVAYVDVNREFSDLAARYQ